MMLSALRNAFGSSRYCMLPKPSLATTSISSLANKVPTSSFVSANAGILRRSIHTSSARRSLAPGYPVMWIQTADKPFYPNRIFEYEIMPRDEFGVPAHIPPDISTLIQHTYYLPPEYYPFIKKLGDDSPEIKPFMDKLIKGQLTFHDYEELFYKQAKPLKVHRSRIPLPYRTEEEEKHSAEILWEGKWHSFRQRVLTEYLTRYVFRDYFVAVMLGLFFSQLWMTQQTVYNEDMKVFYLFAPEHKINWVVPRGDL